MRSYSTGIRCVKVNAYLKQNLGFTNIGRLQNGVIAYEKWLKEKTDLEADDDEGNVKNSLFEGENFLFDGRRLKKS